MSYSDTISDGPSSRDEYRAWKKAARRERRCGGGARWRPVELVAMILGFIFFWPIGLAILFLKMWQRRSQHQGELGEFARERAQDFWNGRNETMRNWPMNWGSSQRNQQGTTTWTPFKNGMNSTGNSAFDDWRQNELARIEEERRKLEAAEQEFANYTEDLRKARDREEFERFMSARRNAPPAQPGTQPDQPQG